MTTRAHRAIHRPGHPAGPSAEFEVLVERRVARWLAGVALVDVVGSLAEACRRLGLERGDLDEARWALETGGLSALRVRAVRSVRRSPAYRRAVRLGVAQLKARHPSWGRKRIARTLSEQGLPVSGSTVRRCLLGVREPTATPNSAVGGVC